MKYRSFKDVQVADIGLGTWQLGSAEWGNVDEEMALSILQAYTDAGGNFIDTADIYGSGLSEKLIGKFLKTVNKEVFIATKQGRRSDGNYGWPQNFSYDSMKRQAESSLENLGQTQLFLEQLHCVPPVELKSGKVFDHLRKFQDEGIIRYFGASVETTEEALVCLEQEGLASLQIIFNLFRQHVADELFERAAKKGVALIVRVPLASGLLSGKFKEHTTFVDTDHRKFNADGQSFNAGETFSGIQFNEGIRLTREIETLLPDERTAQWALRWILDHPQITTVIPGASKINQVNGNVAASDLTPLTTATHQTLRKLYDGKIKEQIRGHY
ncbi:aldo/keto reductase [Pedobacter insulae]|uniref:Predicted oxidoreductase n=1 Tax=Pedobacter insulae TaxID=414048 RepID=A0A1I2WRE4_9SPHI|nr:aldo/keto reductase [Pedobacter insulae]SFH03752.1 Predicted oxidoreductase [Pedobacter insulae]